MVNSTIETLYKEAQSYCHSDDAELLRQIICANNLDIEYRFDKGRTLLHEACYHKSSNVIALLIDMGGDINAINSNGTTPLMYAKTDIKPEQYKILDYLVSKGALIYKKDNFNKTVIDYIAEQDNQSLLLYFKMQLSKINKLV